MGPHTASSRRSQAPDPPFSLMPNAAHPERFVRQIPQSPALPTALWMKKPEDK